jgi:hypothetical protein
VINRAEELAQVVPLRAAPGGIFARSPAGRVSNPVLKPETALSGEAAAAPRGTIAPAAPRQILAEASEQGVPNPRVSPRPPPKPPDQTTAQSNRMTSEARESGPSALEGKEQNPLRSGPPPPRRPPDTAAAQSDRMTSGPRESGPFDSGARPAEATTRDSRVVTENGGATFGTAATKHYRTTFFKQNPKLRGQVVVHHAVEQRVLKKYPGVVTEAEMHSLENLRGIPRHLNSELHLSQIQGEWRRFYHAFPNPTRPQLLQKAAEIDAKYGSQFNPPIKPGH